MKIRKIIIYIMLIIMAFNMGTLKVFAKEKNLRVTARSAIAINRSTGQILFEQNAYEVVPMASTTKILTALVAIESSNLEEYFTVSKRAVSVRGSKVGYKVGEKIKLKELLYGLMFKSGNDAALIIAEGVSGSVEEFCKLMSHYAFSIGAIDSHFMTPHGLDTEDHYSSAYDLALLTARGMDNKLFREIVGSKEIKKSSSGFSRDYTNINKILWKIKGANGVKTGYTGGAGKCLVSSINHNNEDIIIVVLNCTDRWNQTEKIYNYIDKNYTYEKKTAKELTCELYKEEIGSLIEDKDIVKAYKNNTEVGINVFEPYKTLSKNDIVGSVEFSENEILKGEIGIKVKTDLSDNQIMKLKNHR